jgi:hypothetical protein
MNNSYCQMFSLNSYPRIEFYDTFFTNGIGITGVNKTKCTHALHWR